MSAADIAADVAAIESGAAVAATAAEVAVLAADSALQMAAVETAQVVAIAAEKIEGAELAIAENEDHVSWLKQKTTTLEAQHLSTLAMVEALQAEVLELKALQVSPSPALPLETPEAAIPATPPSEAVAAQPEAEKAPERETKRHRLL